VLNEREEAKKKKKKGVHMEMMLRQGKAKGKCKQVGKGR
jgi:hypothetical protein